MQNEPLINANLYLLKSYVQMRFILGKAGVDNKAGAIIEFCAGQKDQVVVGKQFRAACSLRTSIKGIPARSAGLYKKDRDRGRSALPRKGRLEPGALSPTSKSAAVICLSTDRF
jgi:hypothetical protein